MTLMDIINSRETVVLHYTPIMVGSKTAVVSGGNVYLSPAMHHLATDPNINKEERTFIFKNIPCRMFGINYNTQLKTKLEAVNG